jgi:WhiB family redox-sensing transcriptional regulator
MRDAACAACDPDLFFPDERRDPAIGDAKRVCAGCPVQAECLGYSLATRQQHGIWGGLDEWDRADLLGPHPHRRHRDGTQGAA